MHLRAVIDKCQFALGYAPETDEWTDNVVRVINENYLRISMRHPWLFLIKRANITLHAKISGSSSQTIHSNGSNAYRLDLSSGTFSTTDVDGQTLVVDGTEYTINTAVTTSQLSITEQVSISATSDWQIEFRSYPYPVDAAEILDIVSRNDDNGRLIYLDWRTEAELFLDRDRVGTPNIYIEDEHRILLPPEATPSLAIGTAGGSLTSGHTYQYCYTYTYKGMESAPSVLAELEADGNGKIALTGLDDTRIDSLDTNKRKTVYRRDKTANGRWKRITTLAAATTSYTDTGTAIDLEDDIYLYEPGPRPYFRVWTTAAEDKDVEVRYLSKPRRLQADSDTPVWPVAYHDLLVYASLKDLCSAHGMPSQSQLYATREKETMEEMEDRYLTRSDRQYIRRGFDRSRFRKERWGDPVKV